MNPTFYHIPANRPSDQLLKTACVERQVEYIEIRPQQLGTISLPAPGSLLYSSDVERAGHVFQQYLRSKLPLVTLYSDSDVYAGLLPPHIVCEIHNIPMPLTVPILSNDVTHLQAAVEAVGGFPLIIKVLGGSHGVGVMKFDTFSGMKSVVDVLLSDPEAQLIAREFLKNKTHARLIVLGDKVIDSIEYQAIGDEFRTNVGEQPVVVPKKSDATVEAVAVQITKARGLDFGGVDIMFADDGSPLVLEINFPCFFGRAQLLTGVDIAGQMIDFLLAKAKKETV